MLQLSALVAQAASLDKHQLGIKSNAMEISLLIFSERLTIRCSDRR